MNSRSNPNVALLMLKLDRNAAHCSRIKTTMECRLTAEFDLISLSVQLFVCCEICHIEELKITERLKDMNTDGCVIHLESHI